MKLIALVGFTGWAGIVWLAWTLADNRIAACRYSEGWTCKMRATATRDGILTNRITVALVGLLTLMFLVRQPGQLANMLRDKRERGLVRSLEETGLWLQWGVVR